MCLPQRHDSISVLYVVLYIYVYKFTLLSELFWFTAINDLPYHRIVVSDMRIYVASMPSAKEVAVLPSNPPIMTFCIRYQQHKGKLWFSQQLLSHFSLFILFQIIVASKVFLKGTNNFFLLEHTCEPRKKNRILPQRDMRIAYCTEVEREKEEKH